MSRLILPRPLIAQPGYVHIVQGVEYRFDKFLGMGGFGEVWRSIDPDGQLAAFKLCTKGEAQQLVREAKIHEKMKRLGVSKEGPSAIVRMLELDIDCEQPWIKYELVESAINIGDLFLQESPSHPLDADVKLVDFMIKVIDALAVAHQHGFIHGDLSHANILVDKAGNVRIIDFGFAVGPKSAHSNSVSVQSQDGGTPGYMSPERTDKLRKELDPDDDVFSIGALSAMLLLRKPGMQLPRALRAELANRGHRPKLLNVIESTQLASASCRPTNERHLRSRYRSLGELKRALTGLPFYVRAQLVRKARITRDEVRRWSRREARRVLEGLNVGRRRRPGGLSRDGENFDAQGSNPHQGLDARAAPPLEIGERLLVRLNRELEPSYRPAPMEQVWRVRDFVKPLMRVLVTGGILTTLGTVATLAAHSAEKSGLRKLVASCKSGQLDDCFVAERLLRSGRHWIASDIDQAEDVWRFVRNRAAWLGSGPMPEVAQTQVMGTPCVPIDLCLTLDTPTIEPPPIIHRRRPSKAKSSPPPNKTPPYNNAEIRQIVNAATSCGSVRHLILDAFSVRNQCKNVRQLQVSTLHGRTYRVIGAIGSDGSPRLRVHGERDVAVSSCLQAIVQYCVKEVEVEAACIASVQLPLVP